jgi:hypothetical protein
MGVCVGGVYKSRVVVNVVGACAPRETDYMGKEERLYWSRSYWGSQGGVERKPHSRTHNERKRDFSFPHQVGNSIRWGLIRDFFFFFFFYFFLVEIKKELL